MISVPVHDASHVAEARRTCSDVAGASGFDETQRGRVSLVASEIATNIIKHGKGGELLVGAFDDGHQTGIEMIGLDRGPGMTNIQACLADGYSSAGTRGQGLGAVVRQSTFVDIGSWSGGGTAVLARICTARPSDPANRPQLLHGAIAVAKPGEEVCGDSWSIKVNGEAWTLLVADGLGHGPDAADASMQAVRLFHRYGNAAIVGMMDDIHAGLRATRGAAISAARFDPQAGRISFAGIGNVAGVIAANGELKRMVSMAGTAGYMVRKIQAFDYPFSNGMVILHSDGLSATWTLAKYPGIDALHPTLVASILYRDFCRHRDDATVVVVKRALNG